MGCIGCSHRPLLCQHPGLSKYHLSSSFQVIGLIQRVSRACIEVDKQIISQINHGILALIGIERSDTQKTADKLLRRLLDYRIFQDTEGKMNLCLSEVDGALLLVPQFTLAADTKKGMRPSFSSAAAPEQGQALYDYLVVQARSRYTRVKSGIFGAYMQITLTNDGPVTFWLQA
jgi:D-aminoacyl-tRNA deacylase